MRRYEVSIARPPPRLAPVLGGHARAVEARVEHQHGDAHLLELLGEQHAANVARRAAHMMTIITAHVSILREAPLHGPGLRRYYDNLGVIFEGVRLA